MVGDWVLQIVEEWGREGNGRKTDFDHFEEFLGPVDSPNG